MTNTTQEELLPCPFCGAGETSIRENGKVWTGMKYSEPSSVSVLHHCEKIEGQPSRSIERVGRDLTSAIAAWNRRTPSAEQPAFERNFCARCGKRLGKGTLSIHTCTPPRGQPEQPAAERMTDGEAWMHVQGDYREPSLRRLDPEEVSRGWREYPLYAHLASKREGDCVVDASVRGLLTDLAEHAPKVRDGYAINPTQLQCFGAVAKHLLEANPHANHGAEK